MARTCGSRWTTTLLSAVLVLLVTGAASAAEPWVRVGINRRVLTPAAAPITAPEVWSGLLVSRDGGATWRGPRDDVPRPLSPVVRSGGALLAGDRGDFGFGQGAGLLRSTDGGATWGHVPGLLEGRPVAVLAVAPSDPRLVVAATAVGSGAGADPARVYRSADGGATWTAGAVIPASGFDSPAAIVFAPDDADDVTVAMFNTGMFRSRDGGASLAPLPGAPRVSSLIGDPSAPGTLIGLANGGPSSTVQVSVDGGASWAARATPVAGQSVLMACPADGAPPCRLYALGTRLLRSDDLGVTWSDLGAAPPGAAAGMLQALPGDPPVLVTAAARTRDEGRTWEPVAGTGDGVARSVALDPAGPLTILAAMDGGGWRGEDLGARWIGGTGITGSSPLLARGIAPEPAVPGAVWLATTQGVFRSLDGARTWSGRNDGLGAAPSAGAVAVDPTTPGRAYAGLADGVYATTTAGGIWRPAGAGPTGVRALAVDPRETRTLYAGGDGVWRSADRGATWAPAAPLPAPVRTLAVDPLDPATVWAGTDGAGAFRSPDRGATWLPAGAGLDPYVRSLALDPQAPSVAYAATSGGGVFRTTDRGATWAAFNDGLANLSVESLALDPLSRGRLVAGTVGGGVWAREVDAPAPEVAPAAVAQLSAPAPVDAPPAASPPAAPVPVPPLGALASPARPRTPAAKPKPRMCRTAKGRRVRCVRLRVRVCRAVPRGRPKCRTVVRYVAPRARRSR